LEQRHHRELGDARLARAGGRADEHILVGVVDGVEDLGLHGVEVVEAPHLVRVRVRVRVRGRGRGRDSG